MLCMRPSAPFPFPGSRPGYDARARRICHGVIIQSRLMVMEPMGGCSAPVPCRAWWQRLPVRASPAGCRPGTRRPSSMDDDDLVRPGTVARTRTRTRTHDLIFVWSSSKQSLIDSQAGSGRAAVSHSRSPACLWPARPRWLPCARRHRFLSFPRTHPKGQKRPDSSFFSSFTSLVRVLLLVLQLN